MTKSLSLSKRKFLRLEELHMLFGLNFKMVNKLLGLVVLALFCTACGPNNTVPLTYPTKDSSLLPAPNAPRATVVLFQDKRKQPHLGTRSNNTTFEGTSSIPEYISRSFADALSRRGIQVSFTNTVAQARRAGAGHIITGVVTEASLKEVSIAELRVSVVAEVYLQNFEGGRILNENLSASQSVAGIISTSTATELIQSTVQEMIRPGVDKVNSVIGYKFKK